MAIARTSKASTPGYIVTLPDGRIVHGFSYPPSGQTVDSPDSVRLAENCWALVCKRDKDSRPYLWLGEAAAQFVAQGIGGAVVTVDREKDGPWSVISGVAERETKPARKGETMAKAKGAEKMAHAGNGADSQAPLLSWPAAKFRSAIRAALVAASADAERPNMCAVQLRRRNSVLTVTATDGTWLFRWTEPEGQTDEEGDAVDRSPFECLIPRRALESFVDATKKHLELERVLLTGEGARWRLATIMDVCEHEFMQTPEAFPDLESVIPQSFAPTVSEVTVMAGLLTRAAKAFAIASGSKDIGIRWRLSGHERSALVCTTEGHDELMAVVMPAAKPAESRDSNEDPLRAAAQ